MKTIIYYFTGTGNSLAAAKKIAATLEDCELASISSLNGTTGEIVPDAERVGIICPVYFAGLPAMVASFAERLDLSGVGYVFSVLTYGGAGNIPALAQLDSILKKKSGIGLSAGYSVLMPGNYILMYEPATGEKQGKILTSATENIRKISDDIGKCKGKPLSRSLLWSVLHTFLYSWFISGVHNKDRKFSVSNECTSCGICVSICPAGNIELINKKPVWKHHCELCCGCIHLCPVKAIQAGKKTTGRSRYLNPDVTIHELGKVYPNQLAGNDTEGDISS